MAHEAPAGLSFTKKRRMLESYQVRLVNVVHHGRAREHRDYRDHISLHIRHLLLDLPTTALLARLFRGDHSESFWRPAVTAAERYPILFLLTSQARSNKERQWHA